MFSGLVQESYDSRTFGPVAMTNIVGRVIYCLRNAVDHGPINNRFTFLFIHSLYSALPIAIELMIYSNATFFPAILVRGRIHMFWKWNLMSMKCQKIIKHRFVPLTHLVAALALILLNSLVSQVFIMK